MDVYGKWIDECEKQNEAGADDDSDSSEEDEEFELPHKKAGGSAATESVKDEPADSDLDDSDLELA